MKKLKVGLAGVGVLCKRGTGYGSLFRLHPRTKIAAVCDIDEEALEKGKVFFGLKEKQCFTKFDDFVDSDLDIIFIGTPIPCHAQQAIKALESGKHVLCEVTAANTVKDCERLVKAVKKTKKIYMMAENCCYFHFIMEWNRLIKRGGLGKIFYAEGEYVHELRHMIMDPKTKKVYWRSKRAPLHYCTHNLGPLLMMFDDRIVKATGAGKSRTIMPDLGVGTIDMQVQGF